MTEPVTIEQETARFPTIDAGVRIGHVHLKVADLQRALDFYCGVLGFELTTGRPGASVANTPLRTTTSPPRRSGMCWRAPPALHYQPVLLYDGRWQE